MNSLISENTRLGFIGIGNMGSRIARRLLERGYRLMAYNRNREAAEALINDRNAKNFHFNSTFRKSESCF
jgi:3-hydroxyisobutyrate dehydrogenase-like beta-hydroxyacid dehydrogenase